MEPKIEVLTKEHAFAKFDYWQTKKLHDFAGTHIFYCEGDLKIDHGKLDWIEQEGLEFVKIDEGVTIAGLIVGGNFTIAGCLENGEVDFGQVLYVKGDLKAKHLTFGGSEVYVEGNVNVDGVVWTTYNHGYFTVEKDFTAGLLIIQDHYTTIKGKVNALYFDEYCHGKTILPVGVDDYSTILDISMLNEVEDFVPEDGICDENKPYSINTSALYEAIKAGEKVFKTGIQSAEALASGVPALNDDNFAELLTLVQPEEAETTYGLSDYISLPYLDFYGSPDDMGADDEVPPKVCVHKGDLHVASIETGMKSDYAAFSLVVDGNLTVDGDIDWGVELDGCFLLVTGNVTCKNLLLGGVCEFVVLGNLFVVNGVLGHYGDDGGFLSVMGETKANIIVNTTYFNMGFERQPKAVVIGDDYRTGCAIDFDNKDEAEEALLPEFWDGSIKSLAVKEAFIQGKPILRKTAMPASEILKKKLDDMLKNPDKVTELDLSNERLKKIPEQIFHFPNLKKLDLSSNSLETLSPHIGELVKLENFNLRSNNLTALPAEIGKMKSLRTLNVSGNELSSLPNELAQLDTLKELYLSDICYDLPEAFANSTKLEVLELNKITANAGNIFNLKGLKKLVIKNTILNNIGDRFLQLSLLEELNLSCLGRVNLIADLSKLTHLRSLTLDGGSRPYPNPEFLMQPQLWNIPSLEELDLSRWGEQKEYDKVVRACLKTLPDDAFSNMPGLRKLTVSFTELETLPESFFNLKNLEEVSLEYAHLNTVTINRIKDVFPAGVKFDIRRSKSKPQEDNEVNELVKQGSKLMSSGNYKNAIEIFQKAIDLCDSASPYSDYNRLYAQYGLVYSLGRFIINKQGKEREEIIKQLISSGRKALEIALRAEAIWIFTDEGQFQREVNREAGNSLAWFLMEIGELDEASKAIERAVACIDLENHQYINDTKVRILLKQGKDDQAYRIVDQVLTRYPDFGDFKDLKKDKNFLKWKTESAI